MDLLVQHQAIDKSNTFPHLSPLSIFQDSLSNKMPPKYIFLRSFILGMKHYHNNAKQTLNLRAQFNQYMNHNITKEFAFPQMDLTNRLNG